MTDTNPEARHQPSDIAARKAARDAAEAGDARHLVRASAIVSGLMMVAKVLGMATQMAVAAVFGATRAMDAMRVALSIPQMFSTWIEMPVRAALVPLFTRTLHEKGEKAAWSAVSNIIITLSALLAVVTAGLWLAAPLIVRGMAAGFDDPDAWQRATTLSRILLPSMFFSVLAVVLGSLQNIYRRQHNPVFGRVASGAIVLGAVLWFGSEYGLDSYAWGVFAGAVATFLIQLSIIASHRAQFTWRFAPRAPEVREMVRLAFPLAIGLTAGRLDVIFDQLLASFLPEGHLSILLYATILAAILTDLLVSVTSAVLLPHFGHLAAQQKFDEMRRRLTQAILGYLLIMLPVVAVLTGAAEQVVELLYGRGRFTAADVALTAALLPILAVAAPVYAVGQALAQAHISQGDTKTPMKIGFIRISFKAVVSLALLPFLGIYALAISSTFGTFLRTALFWRRLPDHSRPEVGPLLGGFASLAAGTLAAGGIVWLLLRQIPPPVTDVGRFVNLAGVSLAALGGYLLIVLGSSAQSRMLVVSILRRMR